MANNNTNNTRTQLPALTNETIQDLLSVQKHELTIRLEEVKRDQAEISHNQSVAKQSIDAQERDRKHEREEVTKRQKSNQWFIWGTIVILVVFAGYALSVGESALVLDIIKVLVAFGGGMGFQAYRTHKQKDLAD